jgi:hypothetical protein
MLVVFIVTVMTELVVSHPPCRRVLAVISPFTRSYCKYALNQLSVERRILLALS